MTIINPLFATDFYKTGHQNQYPEGTQRVYSNLTPRSDRLANMSTLFDNKIVWFGLAAFIKEHLIGTWNKEFFYKDRQTVVKEYQSMLDNALGAGTVDCGHIIALHELGYLPIQINALPEGSRVNMQVPVMTIENTHPDFFWVTNYLETWLSNALWKTSTAATIAHDFRAVLEHWAEKTGGNKDFIDVQGHDFSCRGMSTMEDAGLTGMGHLLSFIGTDTITAIDFANRYYGGAVGVSVPATEHSVMCMGGEEDELETFRRLITDLYPTGVVSIVSDTWDFWEVITGFTVELKDEIMARQPNAIGLNKVVFRPDSGDPVDILCGDPDAEEGSPEYKGAVECLWDVFGGTVNELGFKTLDQHVGLIYGDSITIERAEQIMERLATKGFASDNVVLGIGSYTYQYVTRDTFGFAVKATWGAINGDPIMVEKNPKTDSKKKSSKGRLAVIESDDGFTLIDGLLYDAVVIDNDMLKVVFLDGVAADAPSYDEMKLNMRG